MSGIQVCDAIALTAERRLTDVSGGQLVAQPGVLQLHWQDCMSFPTRRRYLYKSYVARPWWDMCTYIRTYDGS